LKTPKLEVAAVVRRGACWLRLMARSGGYFGFAGEALLFRWTPWFGVE